MIPLYRVSQVAELRVTDARDGHLLDARTRVVYDGGEVHRYSKSSQAATVHPQAANPAYHPPGRNPAHFRLHPDSKRPYARL